MGEGDGVRDAFRHGDPTHGQGVVPRPWAVVQICQKVDVKIGEREVIHSWWIPLPLADAASAVRSAGDGSAAVNREPGSAGVSGSAEVYSLEYWSAYL